MRPLAAGEGLLPEVSPFLPQVPSNHILPRRLTGPNLHYDHPKHKDLITRDCGPLAGVKPKRVRRLFHGAAPWRPLWVSS